MSVETSKPVLLPTPGVPAHFSINEAIAHELDKMEGSAEASQAVVVTAAKIGDGPITARVAIVLKNGFGDWNLETKVYGEITQGLAPTVGVQVVLMK